MLGLYEELIRNLRKTESQELNARLTQHAHFPILPFLIKKESSLG
jgi:hypothetical protein